MTNSTPITAPMAASVISIDVEPGAVIQRGQQVAVLEAMKMHYEIVADAAGEVTEVLALAGQQVAADDLLIDINITEST